MGARSFPTSRTNALSSKEPSSRSHLPAKGATSLASTPVKTQGVPARRNSLALNEVVSFVASSCTTSPNTRGFLKPKSPRGAAAAAAPGSAEGKSDMAPVGNLLRLCEGVPNLGEWLRFFGCCCGFFFRWTGTASKSAHALTSSGFASSVKKASAPGASQFGATCPRISRQWYASSTWPLTGARLQATQTLTAHACAISAHRREGRFMGATWAMASARAL
mmetsp:Transcript_25241/g.70872  ORF Transcript_25241/g.70872 Transcript_25241/m.70872 type:complete len:220 (+) Transcript_25241:1539-2198(+)